MSQLCCPLCGRFVSLRYFNPEKFDSDIYGVDVKGLGRGKGVEVISKLSVLDVPEVVMPIRIRCLELIRIIDGELPPTKEELTALRSDVQRWKNDALELRKWGNDLQVQVVEVESDMLHWRREVQEMGGLNRDLRARIADGESSIQDWKNHCDKLNASVNELRLENSKLRKKIGSMAEEEELAVEEMDEILEMINSSANTDFEFLVDAVEFLLEVG